MSEHLSQPAPSKPKWSWRAKWIIGIAIASTLLVGKFMLCHFLIFTIGYSASEFNSAWWKWNRTCRCTPIRMQMADHLLATRGLTGMSKQEITDLLGAPDRHAYIQQYEKPGDFVYHLAPNPIADEYWLVVRFEGDHVRDAQVVMD